MRPSEHYKRAEDLLMDAQKPGAHSTDRDKLIATAQVHAILATVVYPPMQDPPPRAKVM